jgi:hypothetical protein
MSTREASPPTKWVAGSISEYTAAAHLLRSEDLRERTERYLDDDLRSIAWEDLLADPALDRDLLSDGEAVLVDMALAFWTSRPHERSDVMDVLQWLDDENFRRFMEALWSRRGGRLIPSEG